MTRLECVRIALQRRRGIRFEKTAGQRHCDREASSLSRLPGETMRSNRAILPPGGVAACQNSSIRVSGEDSSLDDALLLQGESRPAMRIAKRA